MKKILSLISLFLVPSVMAVTFYNGTSPLTIPKSVEQVPFAFMPIDVKLNTGDTTYSQVFDLFKIPLVALDSSGILIRVDTTLAAGSTVVGCYDVSDSAALTDSVIVTTTIQASQYAADNVNPNLPFSAAWDSVGVVTLAKASDANAAVTGTARPTLLKREHRFIRFRLINLSATSGAPLKNVPRCRVYWERRTYLR